MNYLSILPGKTSTLVLVPAYVLAAAVLYGQLHRLGVVVDPALTAVEFSWLAGITAFLFIDGCIDAALAIDEWWSHPRLREVATC